MSYDAIKEGDFVHVFFENVERVSGTVLHIPQAQGECWVIDNDTETHFVNSFARITKDKPFQP